MKKEQIQNLAKELKFNFRSRYEYVKSFKDNFGLDDEECSTFLWLIEMWDKKTVLPEPTDFKLQSTVSSAGKEVKTADQILKPHLREMEEFGMTWNYNKFMDEITMHRKTVIKIMEEHANQFKSSPLSTPISLYELIGANESWPLTDVLLKLIESTEYLLNVNNYDRVGWEEVSHCTKIGREYLSKITDALSKSSPASTVMPEISDEEVQKQVEKLASESQFLSSYVFDKLSVNYGAYKMGEWYSEQLKSKHSIGIQKDQAFLNFITTTGLSAADQNIIKGVYFKYIEQCQ